VRVAVQPKTARFEFSKEFSDLGSYVLDPVTKITTTGGYAGADTSEAAKIIGH
jgi:hypothetical protein